MDLRAQQEQYEIDSDAEAAADRLQELAAQFKAGDVELPRTKRFIARAYIDVKSSIDAVLAIRTNGVGGKFKNWLRQIPTDVLAVLALRECIEQLTRPPSMDMPVLIQSLATGVGRLYETEMLVATAEAVNPVYMQKIHDQVKENATTSKSQLRKLYSAVYDKVIKGELDSKLSVGDIMQLGKFGVQACMDAGVVTLTKSFGKGGTVHAYSVTPEVLEFLSDYNDSDVTDIFNRSTGAMVCQPDPWTCTTDGGYLSTRRKHLNPLLVMRRIRKSERPRIRAEFTAEKMPLVFDVANYLQDTPFNINQNVLNRAVKAWESGGGIMGIPTKNQPHPPKCPMAKEWVKADGTVEELAIFVEWKRQMREHFLALKSWRSRVREITGFIKVSKKVLGNTWFPVFFDTRGRWYYRGSPNPQGTDIAKAALHSGIKRALGARGVYWLKVGIANSYGFDKARFDDRAAWTDANWESIQRALEAPEDHPEVWGNDSPWCMYSAAYELNAALQSGNPEAYETSVFIHMDATCSGLQHFSAMNRDPVGGKYVNLYDDNFVGPKQDIYSHVAVNALRSIQLDMGSSDAVIKELAEFWWKHGIPRNMAKTPVMTFCYGATHRGTMDFISSYAQKDMGLKFPTEQESTKYSSYAATKMFNGIAAAVPAAAATMRWLKSIAGQMPCGKRMEWRTPTGFLVQQDYQDFTEIRIKLRSCGTTDTVMREYNNDTRAAPMRNGISPNFVHALDASHLTLTAKRMKDAGISMVGIHDSFGTHPSDVDTMHSCIREAFIELYRDNNVLSDFLWDVGGIGEVPMRGTLDIERVRDSEFFFC